MSAFHGMPDDSGVKSPPDDRSFFGYVAPQPPNDVAILAILLDRLEQMKGLTVDAFWRQVAPESALPKILRGVRERRIEDVADAAIWRLASGTIREIVRETIATDLPEALVVLGVSRRATR